MPIARRADVRGQAHEYETAGVVAWLLERAARRARADNPKDEYYRVKARIEQHKLSEIEGALVDPAELEAEYTKMIVSSRQRLLQLPALLAERLEGASLEQRRAALEDAIHEALVALAAYVPKESGSP